MQKTVPPRRSDGRMAVPRRTAVSVAVLPVRSFGLHCMVVPTLLQAMRVAVLHVHSSGLHCTVVPTLLHDHAYPVARPCLLSRVFRWLPGFARPLFFLEIAHKVFLSIKTREFLLKVRQNTL